MIIVKVLVIMDVKTDVPVAIILVEEDAMVLAVEVAKIDVPKAVIIHVVEIVKDRVKVIVMVVVKEVVIDRHDSKYKSCNIWL